MSKTTGDKSKPPPSSSVSRATLLSPFLLLAFIFSIAVFYFIDFSWCVSRVQDHEHRDTNQKISALEKTRERLPFALGEGNNGCDLFSGRWVRDYDRPLYEEWECPYLEPQTTCLEHGRPEKDYQYWRWQPDGCSVPSTTLTLYRIHVQFNCFNARLMLEGLRGKRMMFVGDSLNRGQFTSSFVFFKESSLNMLSPSKLPAPSLFLQPRSYKWGGDENGNCYNETTMIEDPSFFGAKKSLMQVITEELSRSTVPITFINITHLSSPRKDAHTSIYKKQWVPLTEKQLADPQSYADCIHWCLPGLQDIWNELLFSKLFYP
ncbi:UNVERIFIED_CONTAM: protein trichome birefringence-like 33 [Sesamum calycinum]|uniref:Protein trichome birefringence-like 33 n=1 Tax=Sesamum calycinum TaxID=2727403 RepID=A0AAW2LRN0_9LAMI